MPGLAGLITRRPAQWAKAQLARMLESLMHERFYVSGTYTNEAEGAYVGWVAREGSFSSRMPLTNETGDVSLVFSGEDFADPSLLSGLGSKGHVFDRVGAGYLAHLYEDDPNFPSVLNGRFHGFVSDLGRGRVVLFNDRFGMSRLYYYETPEAFYFAAEAKALLHIDPSLRRIDNRALGELISCGCVLEDRTLFAGAAVLPPGSAWVFERGSLQQRRRYFSPAEWESQEVLESQQYYDKVKETVGTNLPRYFSGFEKTGFSLTAGLDTRMILAWRRPPAETLPCYTFGGPIRDSYDVTVGRQLAQMCGQKHFIIEAGDDFLSKFPSYAERTVYLSDGCVEAGRAGVLYCCEQARSIAPVRMTGNYGDQVLRGLRSFKPGLPVQGLFVPELEREIQRCRDTYAEAIRVHPLTFVAFRQAPWAFHGLLCLEETQLTMRSPFMDNDIVRLAFQAPSAVMADNSLRVRLIADGNPALVWPRTDLGFGGERGNSLASRLVQEWRLFTFRAEYAFDHGMPQWLAKVDSFLAPLHWERIFLGRHKYTHFRVWYRERLASYVREMLLDERTLSRPYWNRRALEKIVEGHLKGEMNHTSEIHKVLTLELIHRSLLDPSGAPC